MSYQDDQTNGQKDGWIYKQNGRKRISNTYYVYTLKN